MDKINGLQYQPIFLSHIEQTILVEEIDKLKWSSELTRRTQQYGYKYDYTKKSINEEMKINSFPNCVSFHFSYLQYTTFWVKKQVILTDFF